MNMLLPTIEKEQSLHTSLLLFPHDTFFKLFVLSVSLYSPPLSLLPLLIFHVLTQTQERTQTDFAEESRFVGESSYEKATKQDLLKESGLRMAMKADTVEVMPPTAPMRMISHSTTRSHSGIVLLGHSGGPVLSTNFMYINGGRIKEQTVTVEPPIRLRIMPKSGTARPTSTSKTMMAERTRHLL